MYIVDYRMFLGNKNANINRQQSPVTHTSQPALLHDNRNVRTLRTLRKYTVKIEVQQVLPLAHGFERSEKE